MGRIFGIKRLLTWIYVMLTDVNDNSLMLLIIETNLKLLSLNLNVPSNFSL